MCLTSFVAAGPGQFVGDVVKGVEDVEERPSDNDDVVDILQEDHHEGRVADTFEDGAQLTDHAHAADAEVLAHRHLKQEQGYPTRQHSQKVGDQESSWK